ncbi:MAG: 4'-phosphopantetheinyl transferase superfamily protein [Acidimicrobiia bacterium]|nr:4'-phosphopantetheinyl transferase superfamily protein [Acidimicrobiia bacterium]
MDVAVAFASLLPDIVAVVTMSGAGDSGVVLHPEEADRLPSRVLPSRRRDYTLGRHAARQALVQIGVTPGPILTGERREPLWPDGVVGAISHAAGVVTAAVALESECGGIGIDLEHRGRYFPELVDLIAFGDERIAIRGAEDPVAAALELFSAKESIYKAFSPRVGRYFGFAAAHVHWVDDGIVARLIEPLDRMYPADRDIPVNVAWAGGLAVTAVALPPD